MQYLQYYFEAWKKYAVFNGRASRKEYWIFNIINFFILIPLFFLGVLYFYSTFTLKSLVVYIAIIIILLSNIAITVRRFHDIGKSGWNILMPFRALFFLLLEGDKETNKYGPKSKGIYSEIENNVIK